MTKISLSMIAFTCLLAIGTYALNHQPAIAEVMQPAYTAPATVIYGKVLSPETGAFLGISISEHNKTKDVRELEQQTRKHFAVTGYYQSWGSKDNRFNSTFAENISSAGSIPMITWEPWTPISGYDRSEAVVDQPAYRLSRIKEGAYDAYITQYAQDVKFYGKPVMLRFAHEMNGNWYPWGSTFNTPEEYKAAWRHVHEIFAAEGVTNVTWVWSPNEIYEVERVPYAHDILAFYPGDDYVDWVGFSSFNWAGIYKNNRWKSPAEMYDRTLNVLQLTGKPIMIAETASADSTVLAGAKALWIKELASYVALHPEIKGVVWFNAEDNGINWTINSTDEALAAYRESFDDYFAITLKSEEEKTPEPTVSTFSFLGMINK